ncbi:beta-ketoacyl synthase N-terminal-like domain-containing protein [Microvirga sp. 0TCS3.31]
MRAAISVLGHHPFFVDKTGDLMPAALDAVLDPHLIGPGRLLALGETALREACLPLEALQTRSVSPLPVYLGLPEVRPGFTEMDAEAVGGGLARLKELPVMLGEVTCFLAGHAAGLSALSAAVRRLEQGAHDACLVGGVDSYCHPDTMEWLDANRQLVGSVSRSAFVPGEGAGFCLLMTEEARARLSLRSAASLRATAAGYETHLLKSSEMSFGQGLTATIRDAVQGLRLPGEKVNQVICDINGERYRGEEWGFVCLRLSEYFDDPTAYLSPAECWGDVGAASGPLFAMLACQAVARGYARGPRTLLWASSEGGCRAAALLEAGGSARLG